MIPVSAGVTAADIPKAIVVHNLLGAAFMVMTWGAFYQIQPSQVCGGVGTAMCW